MKETRAPSSKKNNWFEVRRALFVRSMVKEFYGTVRAFRDFYGKFSTTGQASFGDIDRLVGKESHKGALWNLKDQCHKLWRQRHPGSEVQGCLLDWLMGSIFHEAM